MTKNNDIIEVEGQKFRVVEQPVDPPHSVRRFLVPADTAEDDIPMNATLLDERESEGLMSRSSKPEQILVGHLVRHFDDPELSRGTVEQTLKSGKFKVRWESTGMTDRYESKELRRIW